MELAPGTLLQAGKFKIIKKLGQGGFGIIYLAHHQSLNKDVCIKEFFYSDLCERAQNSIDITIITKSAEKLNLVNSFKKKFTKEAQRLAQFQHPNIVQVTDTFEENNTAYFVMEYLQGGSLEDLLSREGSLSEQKTKDLILPLIDALDAIHKTDLLHLDIKPANIMLRNNQSPVLIDFGISKYMELSGGVTTTAPVGISKGYAPIEQYGGSISDFSEATDIYSFCATMYKIVTGQTPPEPLQILGSGLKAPHNFNPDLSENFSALIIKGMAIKANDRYQRATDIKKAIKSNKSIGETGSIIDNSEPTIYTQLSPKLNKYEDIGSFSGGLVMVKLNDKKGFIDKTGREVVPCKYDDVEDFSEGLARVKLNDQYGLISNTGEEVVPCNFDYIKVDEGFIYVRDQASKVYIYINGKDLALCKYDEVDFPQSGLSRVKLSDKYGFIDKTGKEVITCKYEDAKDFSEGYAAVKLNGRYGFIDKYDRTMLQFKYLNALSFRNGLALILDWKKGLWDQEGETGYGAIDKKGNFIIKCKYSEISSSPYGFFNNGWAIVGIDKGVLVKKRKFGAIDLYGEEIVPFEYDDYSQVENIIDEHQNSIKSLRLIGGKMWGFDKNNKKLMTLPLIDFQIFDSSYLIMEYEKYGIIDNNGREVILAKFDSIDAFSEGLIAVQLNGKGGFIDKTGREVIPLYYDETWGFSGGLAKVKLNGRYSFIDKQGKVVLA